MGCHSGLAVSDATVGGGAAADDLAAALTARGAAYVATTGYGYGDQVSVGLQERLMTLFAGAARRRRVARRRVAQRQAAVLRQPGSVRRLRREGAVEHDPLRPADVRRRHAASGATDATERDDHAGVRRAGSVVDAVQPGLHVRRASRATSDGGTRPTPAPARSCRRSRPAARCSPAPSSTSRPRRPTTRCCRPTVRSSADCARVRSSPTSTPRSVDRRSTTLPASPRRSTRSPRSRLGWRA